jgi:transposase
VHIQALGRLGLKNSVVSRMTKTNIKTVKKWKSRSSVQDLSRPRVSFVLTDDMKGAITLLCRDEWGASTRRIAKTISADKDLYSVNTTISKSTVSAYVRTTDWGRVAYRAQVKPMLSAKNIRDRLTFCQMVKNQGYCDDTQQSRRLLDHILFTDESVIELYPKPNKQNMRIRTSEPNHRFPTFRPKNGVKIMVAGGLSVHGLTKLHIVDAGSTVNATYYQTRILPTLFSAFEGRWTPNQNREQGTALFEDSTRAVFMQDGAPAHTANSTLALIRRSIVNVWSKGIWPGNSPDLNPIEHIWPVLQNSVFIAPRPRTREELIERVELTWYSISASLSASLVYSFPRRVNECLEKTGGNTNY